MQLQRIFRIDIAIEGALSIFLKLENVHYISNVRLFDVHLNWGSCPIASVRLFLFGMDMMSTPENNCPSVQLDANMSMVENVIFDSPSTSQEFICGKGFRGNLNSFRPLDFSISIPAIALIMNFCCRNAVQPEACSLLTFCNHKLLVLLRSTSAVSIEVQAIVKQEMDNHT